MERKYEICRMRILVIAATKAEIDPLISGNNGVEVQITGVGVPSTLYHLQKNLQQNATDLVIQAGIAGSFTDDIELGEVVLVKQDTFADIGMEEKENFRSIFKSGFADKDAFPFSDGWLVNPNNIFTHSLLPAVKAITVNKVSDSFLQKQQAIINFAPEIESMEGAALHYVCLQENIPFLQIRSISNLIGERDKSKWKLKEAIANLNKELFKVIEEVLSVNGEW
ncbi:MAG: futalosine hydrolase [Ferruginibacter sp.]|nr:futalosine hydrolase [Ferruginibacter sp.]